MKLKYEFIYKKNKFAKEVYNMRRNKNKLKTGILTTIVVILGLGVAGMTGKILDNEFGWIQKTQDYFKKIESSDEDVTSDEPVPENPFDNLVEGQRTEFSFDGQDNISPLSQSSYKSSSSTMKLKPSNSQPNEYTFNSLKMYKNTIDVDNGIFELNLQFGFPSTITEAHTNNLFGIPGFTYFSWILQDYKIKNVNDISFAPDQDLYGDLDSFILVYRSSSDFNWKYFKPAHSDDYFHIEADNDYYQLGLVFATNNKSTNAKVSMFYL